MKYILKANERLGETKLNKQGCLMKIIEYKDSNNIIIEFQDKNKYKVSSTYQCFKNGEINNPYYKTIFNIGYIGQTKTYCNKTKKQKKSYEVWFNMLRRCYKENTIAYKDCYVCEEWLCYANFEKWYNENYYEIENESMQLDKDILSKGNKIYSPETCIFVPRRVNSLFIKQKSVRGKYFIGVKLNKNKKYEVSCMVNGNYVYFGSYDDEYDAFLIYKKEKEQEIKRVANEYKDKIPKKLYDAMYKYKIETTD